MKEVVIGQRATYAGPFADNLHIVDVDVTYLPESTAVENTHSHAAYHFGNKCVELATTEVFNRPDVYDGDVRTVRRKLIIMNPDDLVPSIVQDITLPQPTLTSLFLDFCRLFKYEVDKVTGL